MFDKKEMMEKLQEKLNNMPREELIKFFEANSIEVIEESKEIKKDPFGHCPYCGWSCEDEYINKGGRFVNDKYYDKLECTSCHKDFDRVYEMELLRSQTTLPINVLLKEQY